MVGVGTPFDVLYDIMFNFSTWVSMFSTLVFTEFVGISIFGLIFNPATFTTLFALVAIKKLVPAS
jgi:hypothetical protein